MRLWSLHPSYLDAVGLVALWREGLLARKVLSGRTRGYTKHPQMTRFRDSADPLLTIDAYLRAVADEAQRRGYHFDSGKIGPPASFLPRLSLTEGQLHYEFQHLLRKLRERCPRRYDELFQAETLRPHPLFEVVPGDVSPWEKVLPAH